MVFNLYLGPFYWLSKVAHGTLASRAQLPAPSSNGRWEVPAVLCHACCHAINLVAAASYGFLCYRDEELGEFLEGLGQ